MYKDFNASGNLTTSDEFMTNADTPSLALEDIIKDPINPYTGNPIDTHEKHSHDQYITTSWNWDAVLDGNKMTKFDTSDRAWYSVHDNIFDKSNWTQIPEPSS